MNAHEEIMKIAHDLYERSGRVDGRDLENWHEAERIVMEKRTNITINRDPSDPLNTVKNKGVRKKAKQQPAIKSLVNKGNSKSR